MLRHALRLCSILGLALAATPLVPHVASLHAAIAFDQVAPVTSTAVSNRTWSHTLAAASGTNRMLILTLATEDPTSSDQVVTSVTFNGVAMTAVSGASASNVGNKIEFYYLLDAGLPASAGSYNVAVTFAGTISELTLGTISLTGVKQAAPEATATGSATATNSLSTNITTTSANAWLVSCIALGDPNTLTAGGSAIERFDQSSASSSSAVSTTATTTAGTKAVSWTASASTNRLVQVVTAVAPAVTAITLSGNVFEDVTYTGGAGRTKAAASGVDRSGARVELFDASGNYVSATTSDVSGNYSFSVTPSANYTIRVVNSSVTSSLGGSSLVPVQTFRTTATAGSAVAVTDRVGGENPAYADADNASTTLTALSSGSITPQSITAVTAGTGDITGLDFGFNFSTIVNPNDTGQGSLRQFITNANGMSGTQTSVFMISGGSAVPGLRTGLTNQLTGGVAVITLASALPQITGTLTLDGTSQTTNVGNTNSGTLGVGGTAGVDAVTLSTVNRPEVEISVPSSAGHGLNIAASSTAISGLAIHGADYSNATIAVTGVSGVTISGNVIGATATSFTLPGTNPSRAHGIDIASAASGTISNNLLGYTGIHGINLQGSSSGWTISNNEIRGCGTALSKFGGIDLLGTGHTISGNLLIACKAQAIDAWQDGNNGHTIVNNTVSGSGVGAIGAPEISGIDIVSDNNTVDRNIITGNYGSGITIGSTGTGNTITRNSIYDNGTITNDVAAAATGAIGIDLLAGGDNHDLGTAPYYTLNDSGDGDNGANTLRNMPVIAAATIVGSNLELTGWVAAGSTVEFFISDQHSSGFGSGQTFIGSFVEGGGGDADATTGSYSGAVNCFAQGADSDVARFHFTMAKPGSVSVGTVLTASATDTSGNTSEFSGNTAVISNLPAFTAVKTAQVISDPVNATTNPKAIPGGVSLYSIAVTNTNPAVSDTDTFVLSDAIPAATELFVGDLAGAGSGPVQFVDGPVSSDLTYTFTSLASTTDDVAFSDNNGATWTYVPTPDADGFDSAVTTIRITPKGAFAAAACGDTPGCTMRFRVRVK